MTFTDKQNTQIAAYLLLVLAFTQIIYTALYVAKIPDLPRQFIWGSEALLFTFLAAFSGAAMAQTKDHQLVWAAVALSAVLNVVQVSVGLTLFSSFGKASAELAALKPAMGGVVALSFMIYYTAKLLLGLAALAYGMSVMSGQNKLIGSLTAVSGGIAVVANSILIVFGRDGFLPSSVAGATGVVATLLLALCIILVTRKENR